jgi:hypothetical protein
MHRTLLVLTILVVACPQKPDALTNNAERRAPAPGVSSTSTTGGAPLAPQVRRADGTIDIDYIDDSRRHHLRGTTRDDGKRKYTLDTGPVVLEVKPGNGSFKLRKADGSLLWKVKMEGNKIKVSDNEENRNPIELRNGARGVLDAERIPMMQRAVLYAELLERKL